MDLWTSLTGMVGVELTSADPAGALSAVNAAGITVYYARQTGDLTLRFALRRSDYKRLQALARRRGDRASLDSRRGIYWALRTLLSRPILTGGMLLLLGLSLYLPSRVLFIQVDGNVSIPSQLIIEKAADCGIGFGASRREVRSEKMKNALLQAIPQLQWAGVNTSGCTAVISVRERTEQKTAPELNSVSSIIAARDGVIRELTVLSGNPVCKTGQAVKAGQVLVSGYTDLGICIRATHARAEVFAETQRNLHAVLPSQYSERTEIIHQEKKYSLIFGKKQINFYKGSGISDTTCVKMKTVDYLTLPGGFRLPIALVTEEWTSYDCVAVEIPQTKAEAILKEFSDRCLSVLMVAGRIDARYETVALSDGVFRQYGTYACYEMIGKTKLEENLENYGQTD